MITHLYSIIDKRCILYLIRNKNTNSTKNTFINLFNKRLGLDWIRIRLSARLSLIDTSWVLEIWYNVSCYRITRYIQKSITIVEKFEHPLVRKQGNRRLYVNY